ncbi:MAG: glycoside hydrolase family 3 protein [Anaerolineae bacterium]|nr:glycoside hydrolase family 3 protein [Anaerolineae bacterium]
MQRIACARHFARAALVLPLLLAAFAGPAHSAPIDQPHALLAQLSLEQKVGQLFLITIYSDTLDQADRALIANLQPGGVVLFPFNLGTPQQVTQLTNALQSYMYEIGPGIPLLIAVDQEGGAVSRLTDGFTRFPAPLMLGAAANHADAMQLGYAMGQEMAAVGITMNLAPVADLQYPAQDADRMQVLYRRTLSSDPARVGLLAGGLAAGMRQAGVIGVLKHFPGHGAAIQDSHAELPQVNLSRAEVEQTTLAAFQGAIDEGAAAIMFGHLYYPALDPGGRRPASLSPVVIDLLRNDMGFSGVTISDAMDMGAILKDYSMSEAVIASINAGMDMIAFGPHVTAYDQQVVVAAVIEAARAGRIAPARLDEAVARALALRNSYGLMDWTPLDVDNTEQRLRQDEHRDVLMRLALHAVTVLDNSRSLLPLDPDRQRIVLVYPVDYSAIVQECLQHDPDAIMVAYSYEPSAQDISGAITAAAQADRVVVFIEDIAENRRQYDLVWALPPEKTVAVSLRSPYDWIDLPVPLSTVVLTYDSTPAAHRAACRVVYGVAPARGSLPVVVGPYPVGTGVLYDSARPILAGDVP